MAVPDAGDRDAPEARAVRSKYYYREHEAAYRQIELEGKTTWEELHGDTHGFERFLNRPFLERVLPTLALPVPAQTDVLEYGCGTGPAACYLSARGYRVEAIDLIPRATTLARRFAAERSLAISFAVQDVCALADREPAKAYDLIVDSYCLQSIVTDADRARLFAAVRARLRPGGYYLISTAMYDPARTYEGDYRFDERSGICYEAAEGGAFVEGAVLIGGRPYWPHRRHRRPRALAREISAAGFRILRQDGELGGDLVSVRDDSGA